MLIRAPGDPPCDHRAAARAAWPDPRHPRAPAWARGSSPAHLRAPSRRAPRSIPRTPRARPRPSSRGRRRRVPARRGASAGVNHSRSTASAIASMPSARTVAARASQFSGVPKRADVQARTSRSIRCGRVHREPHADDSAEREAAERDALQPALVEQSRARRARAPRPSARAGCHGCRRVPDGRSAAPRTAGSGPPSAAPTSQASCRASSRAPRPARQSGRRSARRSQARGRGREEDRLPVALQPDVEAIAARAGGRRDQARAVVVWRAPCSTGSPALASSSSGK